MKIEKKGKKSQNGKQGKPIVKPAAEESKKVKKPSLQKLVEKNAHFKIMPNGKLKCVLTGHEMEATIDNYNKYMATKSYKNGLESLYDISEYENILVEHRDHPKFLFCQLTGAKIPKRKTAIEKHVNGKKFLKKLEEAQAQQDEEDDEEDVDEIDDEDDEDDEQEDEEEAVDAEE